METKTLQPLSTRAAILADILYTNQLKASARAPIILPVEEGRKLAAKSRATVCDIMDRLRRRGFAMVGWSTSDLSAVLAELVSAGVLSRAEGGFAITSMDSLRRAASVVYDVAEDAGA